MAFFFFIWDGENDRHIAEHGVSYEEAEYVVCFPDDKTISRSSGRNAAYGYTPTGKRLFVAYELFDDATVYIVTAYEV